MASVFDLDELKKEASEERQLLLDNQREYDSIDTSRKMAYGAAQETTLTGNLFRYGEALYDSVKDNISYTDALSLIEDQRAKRYF